jgi:hypothetical protein
MVPDASAEITVSSVSKAPEASLIFFPLPHDHIINATTTTMIEIGFILLIFK